MSRAPITSLLGDLQDALLPADPLTGQALAEHTNSAPHWSHVDGRQSIDFALYRWGGDSDAGVRALVAVALPTTNRFGHAGITLDVGISIANQLAIEQAALILRDGTTLVTSHLPATIVDILPLDASVARVDGSFLASEFTGVGDPGQRPNDLKDRVNWSSLGPPPSNFGPLCGFAVRPSGPPGPAAASEIVVEGISHMALAHGFIDPRVGIAALRDLFGLEFSTGQPNSP